eukprot:750260-Amorphochlora_amoeboformis.AAC.2
MFLNLSAGWGPVERAVRLFFQPWSSPRLPCGGSRAIPFARPPSLGTGTSSRCRSPLGSESERRSNFGIRSTYTRRQIYGVY